MLCSGRVSEVCNCSLRAPGVVSAAIQLFVVRLLWHGGARLGKQLRRLFSCGLALAALSDVLHRLVHIQKARLDHLRHAAVSRDPAPLVVPGTEVTGGRMRLHRLCAARSQVEPLPGRDLHIGGRLPRRRAFFLLRGQQRRRVRVNGQVDHILRVDIHVEAWRRSCGLFSLRRHRALAGIDEVVERHVLIGLLVTLLRAQLALLLRLGCVLQLGGFAALPLVKRQRRTHWYWGERHFFRSFEGARSIRCSSTELYHGWCVACELYFLPLPR
mmetsp:Transcript_22509/g.56894  ORF Transcript_22509/g.56894 Transcript_22509/m.56894 type:complete len:271 (+) Transcript_22509:1557-2369(+)